MTRAIENRGPDAEGTWIDDDCGIALGHRRLSILDLSPAGHQPMVSADGRYVITFNGEIYNYRELRTQLEDECRAPRWRGHSDTEVALAAFSAWGLFSSLQRFNGMFAMAVWDRRERVLTLARDRAGEKPLYYGWQEGTFLFASELKALAVHPAWQPDIDRNALAAFMRYGYVPTPWSIFRGILKLQPGALLQIPSDVQPGSLPEPKSFWSIVDIVEAGLASPLVLDDREAIDKLDQLLRRAVLLRMQADVPLGAFLSGGIDSSTVVALMQAQSSQAVKTFSIGFEEADYNEAPHAKAVAKHLRTDHTELYVDAKQTIEVIPRLPHLYDEPFADSSQIPTFLVAELARRHVTVSLSGDAGDELFGGYNRYVQLRKLWSRTRAVPAPVRKFAARVIRRVPRSVWDFTNRQLPSRVRIPAFGDKLHKLASILMKSDLDSLYLDLISQWHCPTDVVCNAAEYSTAAAVPPSRPLLTDLTDRMLFTDFVTYLPDDILTKVDRASMGVSLESRIPLLDPDVIAFAWRLPLAQKIRHGQGKWILRQVLNRYVPQDLIDRPKMGFGIPLGDWLRSSLRDWVEDLLNETRLKQDGWFHADIIRTHWREHLSGSRQWHYRLWTVLMFQAWLESYRSNVKNLAAARTASNPPQRSPGLSIASSFSS